MRQTLWCGIILCGAALQVAIAQQAMGTQQTAVGSNQSAMAAILEPVTNAQYQAEKVSRSVQTLGDGTVIARETRGLIARDAQGRMRDDLYLVQSSQINGHQQNLSLQSATVGDPVTHTMLFWTDEKTKIAMRMELPSLPKLPNGGKGGVLGGLAAPPVVLRRQSGGGSGTVQMLKENAPPPLIAGDGATLKDQVRTEDLGKQSIQGTLVTGKRMTTTIPTGKIGNDRPIVVVHEEWQSPELKILVKTIDTDPRTGEQTMELQGLTRADPDATLFQAPPGYKVQDMSDMLKSLGNIGKTPTPTTIP